MYSSWENELHRMYSTLLGQEMEFQNRYGILNQKPIYLFHKVFLLGDVKSGPKFRYLTFVKFYTDILKYFKTAMNYLVF